MRSTSATKLIHNYELEETGGAPSLTGAIESTGSANASSLRLPNFDYGEAAVAARIAGRRNAAQITESEHDSLLLERQVLLNKVFAREISSRERNRLEYIRWQLDRIEDSLHGDATDFLEGAIERLERLSKDMNDLTSQLSEVAKGKR
jgi:signal transduction histidine kinase